MEHPNPGLLTACTIPALRNWRRVITYRYQVVFQFLLADNTLLANQESQTIL